MTTREQPEKQGKSAESEAIKKQLTSEERTNVNLVTLENWGVPSEKADDLIDERGYLKKGAYDYRDKLTTRERHQAATQIHDAQRAAIRNRGLKDNLINQAPLVQGLGILGGGNMVKIVGGDQPERWGMVYQFGGQRFVFTFDSEAQVEQAFGSDWGREVSSTTINFEDIMDRATTGEGGTYMHAGSAGQWIGVDGNFASMMDNAVYEAASTVGITDPTLLGQYVRNPDILKLVAQGAVMDWTGQRLQGEIRKTDFYKNTLYPGIEQFYGYSTNPGQEWRQYNDNLSSVLQLLGFERGKNGDYRETVGEFLRSGVDDESVVSFAPALVKAQQFEGFRPILNEWLERDGRPPIDGEGWIDLFAGTSEIELGDIAERAHLQYAAQQQGLSLAPEQVDILGSRTDLDDRQRGLLFGQVASQVTALGRTGLQQLQALGFTEGDGGLDYLLHGAAGLGYGGLSEVEINQRINQVSTNLGAADDPLAYGSRQQRYRRFTQTGA